jgi:hypothetical protein
MKLKLTGALVVLLLLNFKLWAQDSTQATGAKPMFARSYKTAVGIQLHGIGLAIANPKGLSIKHFVSSRSALEFNLTPGGRNIIGSNLLLLRHFQVYDAPQLQWYAGAGVNLDVYRYKPVTTSPNPTSPDPGKRIVANTTTLMGVLGAEYRFPNIPFSISADIKKGFVGFTHRGTQNRYDLINGLRPSLSFRYLFGKQTPG